MYRLFKNCFLSHGCYSFLIVGRMHPPPPPPCPHCNLYNLRLRYRRWQKDFADVTLKQGGYPGFNGRAQSNHRHLRTETFLQLEAEAAAAGEEAGEVWRGPTWFLLHGQHRNNVDSLWKQRQAPADGHQETGTSAPQGTELVQKLNGFGAHVSPHSRNARSPADTWLPEQGSDF